MDEKQRIRLSAWVLFLVVGGVAALPLNAMCDSALDRNLWTGAPVSAEPWPDWMRSSSTVSPSVDGPAVSSTSSTEAIRHLVAEGLDSPMAACVVDLDKDGKSDVLAADLGKGALVWWRNRDGKGLDWERQVVTEHFPGANAVEAVDLDGDGDLDVIGAAYDPGNEVSWWENVRGDGSEWVVHTVAMGVDRARSVRAVDMNRDGRPELLVSALGSGLAWWERPAQGEKLWKKHEVAQPTGGVAGVWGGDLDKDGDPDIVAALPDKGVVWWENVQGNGLEWKERPIVSPLEGAEEVRVGDLDADGDLDVVVAASRADRVCWLENKDGMGNAWTEREIQNNFDGAYGVALADLDGDGDLDVAGVSRFGNAVVWWENDQGKAASWKAYRLETGFTNACAVLTGVLERGARPGILAVASGKGTIAWWEASKAVEMPAQPPAVPVEVAKESPVSPDQASPTVVQEEARETAPVSVAQVEKPVWYPPLLPPGEVRASESKEEDVLEEVSWDSLVETAQRQVLLDVVKKVALETSEPAVPAGGAVAQAPETKDRDLGVWIEMQQSLWTPQMAENVEKTEKVEKTVAAGSAEALSEAIPMDLFENPFEQNRWTRNRQSPWEMVGTVASLPDTGAVKPGDSLKTPEIAALSKKLDTPGNAGESLASKSGDSASNKVALTLRDFAGEPGALTRLRVGCRQPKGISGFDVKVAYDPRVLSVQRVVNTTFTQSCMLADNGTMAKGELNVTAVTRQTLDSGQGEEALFEIEFKVAEDAQPGAVVRSIFIGANLFDSLMCPVSVAVTDEAFFRVLPRFMVGDANGDNRVNAADALLALQFSRGIETMNAQPFLAPSVLERVDMNKDGRVDGVDVRLIQSLAVGMSLNPDTIAAAEKAEAANGARLARSEKPLPDMPVEPVFQSGTQDRSQVVQAGQDQTVEKALKDEKAASEASQDPAEAVSDSRLEILQMLLEKSQKESLARSEKENEGDGAEASDKAVSKKSRRESVRETVSARPAPQGSDPEGEKAAEGDSGSSVSEKKFQPLPDDPAPAVPDRKGRIPVPEKVIEMRNPERIREAPEQKELPRSRVK
jgi:hypothetical protein